MLAACGDNLATSTPPVAATAPAIIAAATTTAANTTTAATTSAANALPTVTNLPPPATTSPVSTTVAASTTVVATTVAVTTVAATTTSVTTEAANTTVAVTSPASTTAAPTTAPATVPPSTGASLAFVEGGSLNVFELASKKKTTLFAASPQQVATGRPDWQPGNQAIAFGVQATTNSKNGGALYLATLSNGQSRKLLANQPAGTIDIDPRWSPNGQFLAFTRTFDNNRGEVWLVDSDGQNPRKLANGQQPTWAPDSLRIAYVTDGTTKGSLTAAQNNALKIINVRGQNEWEPINVAKLPTDLSNQGFPFGPGTLFIQHPTWLDGGRTLAFTTVGHSGLIVTINSSTGRDVKVWDTQYEGGFGAIESTQQGSMVAYQTLPPSGFPGIAALNTSGTPNLQKPPTLQVGSPQGGITAFHPTISPNGTQLAYLKATGGSPDNNDFKNVKGSLIVAQIANGKLDEQELFKGNIQSIAWTK